MDHCAFSWAWRSGDFIFGSQDPFAGQEYEGRKIQSGGIRRDVHRIYGGLLRPLPGRISTGAGASFFIGSGRRTGRLSTAFFLFGSGFESVRDLCHDSTDVKKQYHFKRRFREPALTRLATIVIIQEVIK